MKAITTDLDQRQLSRFLKIGILGAAIILLGDLFMGWGVKDESLRGIAASLSPYETISDTAMFLAALFGMIGVPLAVIGHYAIYQLLKPYAGKYALGYALGMAGFLIFGGAGVHVSSVEGAFFYKYLTASGSADVLGPTVQFALYFLLPLYIILISSWAVMVYCHLMALLNGFSPFPKWGWIFSMLVGTILVCPLGLFGNHEIVNAIMMGAFSFGNIWCLGGHLWMLKKGKRRD